MTVQIHHNITIFATCAFAFISQCKQVSFAQNIIKYINIIFLESYDNKLLLCIIHLKTKQFVISDLH
jgi:hypothetical protein